MILGQQLGVFQTKLIRGEDLVNPPLLGVGMWVVEREEARASECANWPPVCDEECWRVFRVTPEN